MRRKDREKDENFALEVADKCEYAVIAMTDTNKMPYCIPISPAREGKTLYFHCANEGEKTENLRRDPHVCVTCAADVIPAEDKFTVYYSSAVIRGITGEVTDDDEKIHALELICERYTPQNMAAFDKAIAKSLAVTSVWRIDITEAVGKQKTRN